MTTLEAAAVAYLRQHIDQGWPLDKFLVGRPCAVTPAVPPECPAIWIYVGGHMFADAVGEERVKLKPWQMGVTYCWRDGRNEHAIFDARVLWENVVDPKPKQLELWAS